MKLTKPRILIAFLFLGLMLQAQTPEGELKRWHKVTLTFNGPNTSETANPNPFSDYLLEVIFTHQGSNSSYKVPGYFAACGNAENNSCNSGNKWRVHFAPDRTGTWNWSVSFKSGSNVAINGGGSNAGFMNGDTGSFNIAESDKSGRDHRAKEKGRIKYVGEHYLKHIGTNPNNPNGDWFVKAGADAPENTLAYNDFDNTPNRGNRRKNWNPHQQDYAVSDAGDYTWDGGKGTELLGAVSYLSDKGVNAFSFLTLSLHGDDENVFPHLLKVPVSTYNGYNDGQQWNQGVHKDRFDVSKLAQWEKIFEYADKKGMYMHFKTMETENDNIMDGNNFGRQRKLYYRELIARFGHHLALNWNLTEETTIPDDVVKSTATFIKQQDPYDHNIVIHTYPNQQDQRYNPLLGDNSDLTGASIQTNNLLNSHRDVKKWVDKSRQSGKKWIVALDEPGNAQIGVDKDPNDNKLVRHEVLWATLLAGGAGVEYYYGYSTGETDLSAQDHRSRDKKYSDAARALQFFNNYLQDDLVDMVSSDGVTSDNNDYVFGKAGEIYAIYRPNGGSTGISLPSGNEEYEVQWYNPRGGSGLSNATTISGNLVAPDNNDWVALVKKKDGGGGGPDQCVALEQNGVVAVEAEHFESQSKTDDRQWYVLDGSGSTPNPDPDPDHSSGASNGGYLEILPDTRVTHDDPLVNGVSFSNTAGQVAIINYKVKFTTPGKYFVWVRAYSTGSEDNGIHVGLNGTWPASGNRMQWCQGKNQWTWESKQRTNANHCGEAQQIYLDIPSAGVHTISFSMREDGFEIDKFVLSKSYTKPTGDGPAEVLVDCEQNTPPEVSIISPVNGASFEIGESIPLIAESSDSDGTIEKVEFFINNNLAATERIIPYETSTILENPGSYTIVAKSTDNEGAVTSSQSVDITVEDDSVPPIDVIDIPGSFEAENFEIKSGSVRIEDTPGTTSDRNLGFIRNGDFVDYAVNVDETSEYTFDFYASSKGVGGTVEIVESGAVVGSIDLPVTGEWHNYKKYSTTVSLTSGQKPLRLSFQGGSGYLYNIDRVVATKIQPVEQTITLSPIHDAFLQGSSRYNSDMVRVELNNRTGYLMFDLSSINGTITNADLTFTVFSDAGNGNISINKGTSNNWTENNLSNANKPGKGAQLGSLNDNFPVRSTKTIPLKTAQIFGNRLSLIIDAISGNDFAFASKENGTVAEPTLIITYTTNRDYSKDDTIVFYPNPVVDVLQVSGETAGKTVKMYNSIGVLVKQVTLEDGQNTIDMSDVSSGIYIVNILQVGKTNKLVVSKKIIKR
ncbi:carbohydrate-binding protein [Aquimarina sp. M1]